MDMKTRLIEYLVAGALAAAAVPVHAQIEKRDVHIAVGGKVALYYLPLTITERLGYFKEEGLNYLLSKGGLKPTDVAIIGIGAGANVIAAVDQGRVDVISQTDPAVTILEKEGKVKVIAETRTPEGTQSIFGGPMPAASFYAPIDYVKKNPNTVQALTNAMVRALLWMQEASPQQILATVPEEYTLGNKAMYLFAYNNVKTAYSKDGYFSEAGAKTTLKALASFNPAVKPEAIDLAQTYTNEFVKKAHAKYGKNM